MTTDPCGKFTGAVRVRTLQANDMPIRMDGLGCWMEFDNHLHNHQMHPYDTPGAVEEPPACQAA